MTVLEGVPPTRWPTRVPTASLRRGRGDDEGAAGHVLFSATEAGVAVADAVVAGGGGGGDGGVARGGGASGVNGTIARTSHAYGDDDGDADADDADDADADADVDVDVVSKKDDDEVNADHAEEAFALDAARTALVKDLLQQLLAQLQ